MAFDSSETKLSPQVASLLDRLRGKIRRYVWLEGIAVAVAWLGIAFWISLLVDQPWVLESPPQARAAVLVGVGLVLLYILFRLIFRRALTPLSRHSMAVVLERRFKHFDDSLLTAVELTDHPPADQRYGQEMLASTLETAQERARDVELNKVFDSRPLVRSIAAATLLVISVAAFALLLPEPFGVWMRRNLLLSEERCPRDTQLELDGFKDGAIKIARGSDLAVLVKAHAQPPKIIPRTVEIRYRTDEGFRERRPMERDGVADPRKDKFQLYSHTFQGVLTPIRFDVVGGDDRLRNLRIDVVDRPTLIETVLHCVYPAYMQREPRDLPVTGVVQLPEGARITLRAKANKDLVRAQIDQPLSDSASSDAGPPRRVLSWPKDGVGPRAFELPLGELRQDVTLRIKLSDTDGIESDPIRLAIGMTADQSPRVDVQLRGIGTAVTPRVRIPVRGELADDYGLAEAWFEYAIDEAGETRRHFLTRQPRGRAGLKLRDQDDEAFDVRDSLLGEEGDVVELKPGQKLLLAVKTSDSYALADAPHEGSSQRFLLDVVTPEQLRTILESKELNLRRRFESILEEATGSRDALGELELGLTASPVVGPAGGEEAASDQEPSPHDRDALGVQRALQNSRKNAQETLGVATSFEDIRDELVNNRVDTEELKSRLTESIAKPLRHIGEDMFPELERRLETLQSKLTEREKAEVARAAAVEQADAILVEMQQVLSKMLELETFNEALAMLRSILESQEKLNALTDEVRKQKARELLQD